MKSTLLTLALTIMLASTVIAQQNTATGTKKLYIEEHIETTLTRFVSTTDEMGVLKNNEIRTTRDISLIVTNDVTKQCPSLVRFLLCDGEKGRDRREQIRADGFHHRDKRGLSGQSRELLEVRLQHWLGSKPPLRRVFYYRRRPRDGRIVAQPAQPVMQSLP